MAVTLSLDDPVVSGFVFYTVIVVVKMLAMALLTAKVRITRGLFANQEDVDNFHGKKSDKRPVFGDEDVERVRRNHLNDLENIVPFVLIGLVYVMTGPSYSSAIWHFRVFAGSRVLHTLCYQIPIPQPSRGLAFVVGLVTTLSMAVQTFMAVM